jgi:N-acylneuraminate cytidylyltransferase
MSNIAIIPARGGSKRIPKKNIRLFFGKPIIAYPIKLALESGLFDEVMVSTDSDDISAIAEEYGASVPFKRSESNSDDHATLADVLVEVVESYLKQGKRFDVICCILPTAVLINQNHLLAAFNKFKEGDFDSVVPVLKFSYPIQRALKDDGGLLKMKETKYLQTRSQDLEPHYHDSGQFYWIKTEKLLIEKSLFTSRTGYVEINETESQDVDTLTDWEMLTIKYNYLNKLK